MKYFGKLTDVRFQPSPGENWHAPERLRFLRLLKPTTTEYLSLIKVGISAGKASTSELNGYDIRCPACRRSGLWRELESFNVAFGMTSLPLLNQRIPLSGGVTLPSGYGGSRWPCPVIGRVSLRPMTASPQDCLRSSTRETNPPL